MPSSGGTAPGLTPVLGATLFKQEIERRKKLHGRGVMPTGCSEIDDALLLGGGFERGCVIGVSAEEVDFGVLLGLQTIARALVFEDRPNGSLTPSGGEGKQRATIITTLPVTAILPTLRDVIRYQVQTKLSPRNTGIDAELRRCLEAISISRIFDIEGLWEVLQELEETQAKTRFRQDGNEETASAYAPGGNQEEKPNSEAQSVTGSLENQKGEERESIKAGPEQADADLATIIPSGPVQEPPASSPEPATELPPLRVGPELRPLARNSEVPDSEDEEPLSSSPLSSPPPSTVAPQSPSPSEEHPQPPAEPDPHPTPSPDPEPEERPPSISTENSPLPVPDIILVTHFSALLTTLFTHSDKTSAHTSLQLLSSRLRHLAQSAGPLIMLLNTTTSPPPEPSTPTPAGARPSPDARTPVAPTARETTEQQRPLDPTLRSIFNPGPHLRGRSTHDQGHRPGHGYGNPHSAAAAASSRLTRRNKPSFGAIFAQFLDLHLLCTKVPRTRDDAETAVALGPGATADDVRYAWVVEALLDELGVWDWKRMPDSGKGAEGDGLPPRVNREQRWGAVDVRDRVAVVNAFGARAGAGRGCR
ncbi:hypothetical protein F4824DRAFT_356022 [Ustulina deusta]|nr:hypothetical protein F4824DRAFT_356022 [Ustulina deusta]